jgi:hypothetical protein
LNHFVLVASAVFLTGCATPQPAKPPGPAPAAGAEFECVVRIVQEGQEVVPAVNGNLKTYKLEPDDFRIEVRPASCAPTMALVGKHHLSYITQTPLVFSPMGVFGAGSAQYADILAEARGDNPRTSLDEVIERTTRETSAARFAYDELCGKLGYCPAPVLAFSTAWPFLDPKTRDFRGYAEFRRFTQFTPTMSTAAGRVLLAVVYTQYAMVSVGNRPMFYVLRPHAIELDFR